MDVRRTVRLCLFVPKGTVAGNARILFTVQPEVTLALQNEGPQSRDQRWLQDIEFFATQFPVLQMDADKLIPPAKFRAEIKGIEDDVPHLPDSEIVLRLIHLVASAGVGHDTVFWLNGPYALHRYPLRFVWLSDGPAVTSAAAEYESALGARILRIGSMTPQQFESAAASYYSYENLSRLRAQGPVIMMTREMATHFGLAAADGSVDIAGKAWRGAVSSACRASHYRAGDAPDLMGRGPSFA